MPRAVSSRALSLSSRAHASFEGVLRESVERSVTRRGHNFLGDTQQHPFCGEGIVPDEPYPSQNLMTRDVAALNSSNFGYRFNMTTRLSERTNAKAELKFLNILEKISRIRHNSFKSNKYKYSLSYLAFSAARGCSSFPLSATLRRHLRSRGFFTEACWRDANY